MNWSKSDVQQSGFLRVVSILQADGAAWADANRRGMIVEEL